MSLTCQACVLNGTSILNHFELTVKVVVRSVLLHIFVWNIEQQTHTHQQNNQTRLVGGPGLWYHVPGCLFYDRQRASICDLYGASYDRFTETDWYQ